MRCQGVNELEGNESKRSRERADDKYARGQDWKKVQTDDCKVQASFEWMIDKDSQVDPRKKSNQWMAISEFLGQ